MENNYGWVSIHRKIWDCDVIWKDKPFSRGQAWVDLLLMANYEDKEKLFNGSFITIKRGQTLTSLTKLADRWGWSRKKTTKFINELKKVNMVDYESTNKYTTITVINYEVYQDMGTTKEPQKNHRGTSEEHQRNTNNNINNINNINKKGGKPQRVFVPPTLEEVSVYCKERNNGIDAQAFIDFYSSKGWMIGKNKMKDWKAAVRTWERRGTKQSKIEIDTKFRDFLDQNQVVDFNT